MDVLRAEGVNRWCTRDISEDSDHVSLDATSNDDYRSSSFRSDSVVSLRALGKSRQRSKINSSTVSQSDHSCNSEFSRNIVPSAKSEGRILKLLAGSGYPMTQINGQRKLGPPPGWTKPAPDPSCEVFVGKLPRDLHEDAIYPIFRQIGEIYEIRLLMDFSGTNRGYCFVMYTKPEYAQQAIKHLNNWEICRGQRIGVVASLNNCRLCIGQLPSDIDSEVIVNKFFTATDEVSSVSVYKNINGRVRYALVLYCNHRAAAMARRSLLPQRGNLFNPTEITVDWAHPDMVPNNVVEEKGTRDESGHLKISRTVVGPREQRDALRKREMHELPISNIGRNGPNQRDKWLELSRRGVCGRGRSRSDDFSADRRPPNHSRCIANSENGVGHLENESATRFPGVCDINGNIEISDIRRLDESKNDAKTVFRGNELNSVAQNFPSGKYPASDLFKGYTVAVNKSPTDVGADDRYEQTIDAVPHDARRRPSFLQTREKLIDISNSRGLRERSELQNRNFELFNNWRFAEKSSNHRENERIETTPCAPRKHFGLPSVERPKITIEARQSANFCELGRNTKRNGNFEVPQPTNTRAFVGHLSKNLCNNDGAARENNDRAVEDSFPYRVPQPFCQECHDQTQLFLWKFVLQASNPLVRHGSHVFDNYFRGPNGRADNSTPSRADRDAEKRPVLLPFCSIVPRSLYATSSFAEYSVPASICIEEPRRRPSPNPNSEKLDETIFGKPKSTPPHHTFACEQ